MEDSVEPTPPEAGWRIISPDVVTLPTQVYGWVGRRDYPPMEWEDPKL